MPFLKFLWTVSHSKHIKFACSLGGRGGGLGGGGMGGGGVSWLNYPKLTKNWPFLSIPHACPAFLKYALRGLRNVSISESYAYVLNE